MSTTVNIHRLELHIATDLASPWSKVSDAVKAFAPIAGVQLDSHTKVLADGTHVAGTDPRTDHIAVIDHASGLMWAVESLGDAKDADSGISQADCEKRCAELRLLGFDDWRLPTRTELAALTDDTRHEPAIDAALFPRVKPRWHWTSTAAAWSASSAWNVYFYGGSVYYFPRNYSGFALAVRRAGQ